MTNNNKKRFYYLINIQFLGFRYSGWQKQTNAKTIQGMVDKTFFCILGHDKFKTLGAGRTDTRVSANEFAFELFVYEELDVKELLKELNLNLPADIEALRVREVDNKFKIINDPKVKEYFYMFATGQRIHPFCTPFMVCFRDDLNIELMKKGAKLFEGIHNFQRYCYKPSLDTKFVREVLKSEIVINDLYTASFFPPKSWIFHVHGKGFMRQQIRLMVGALVKLGLEEISLEDIKESLLGGDNIHLARIAPSSGLNLNKVVFE